MAMERDGRFRSMAGGAAAALLLLLAGCGHGGADTDNQNAVNEAAATVEDVSPDSLSAPDNMPLAEESRNTDADEGESGAAPPPANASAPAGSPD